MTVKQRLLGHALAEARAGSEEGGIPIGAALIIDGQLIAQGRNRRVQANDPVLHAEIDCLQRAGRMHPSHYARATLVTTLSPCDMCAGAILLFGIHHVIVGEHDSFRGPEQLLRRRGVRLEVLGDPVCRELMARFTSAHPELWAEDIGQLP
ncbi:nucleoside deaminase [Leucobacter sp. M11]|uniref:nucleoside deaminase n=1 Tax=Leucobacter sp. M11 TaxID=2993565 RepID=UPI002D7EA9F4|nr:nucleoside deaminase [Leucobacter sp. M11]MEB4616126.1 nucleoside deaminase [Leucobacter sp. M11]